MAEAVRVATADDPRLRDGAQADGARVVARLLLIVGHCGVRRIQLCHLTAPALPAWAEPQAVLALRWKRWCVI